MMHSILFQKRNAVALIPLNAVASVLSTLKDRQAKLKTLPQL